MADYPVKSVRELLANATVIRSQGRLPDEIAGLTQDSRLVQPGFIFIARRGGNSTGWDFARDAVRRGAAMIVSDQPPPYELDIPVVLVADIRRALTVLAHGVYNNPSRHLKTLLVTGTDGKSSSTFILQSIINASGGKCGLIGTIHYDTIHRRTPAGLTTPDIDRICTLLNEMVGYGATHMVMEASSHSLVLGRLEGIKTDIAGITHISPEHQDFHRNMEEYAAAKARLFAALESDGVGVINLSMPWADMMMDACRGRVITYGPAGIGAQIEYRTVAVSPDGGRFHLKGLGFDHIAESRLIGGFQGENIAMCAAMAAGIGLEPVIILEGISRLQRVPGRMEPVDAGQPFRILVDYSHTPDALKNALKWIRPLTQGRIICVFGCGGNRDRQKRPLMGAAAATYADRVFITSDNPRFEEPEDIIGEIINGVPSELKFKIATEPDRKAAIHMAVQEAMRGDIVIICGKGHEDYLEVKGVRTPFDDRQIAQEALNKLGWISKMVEA